MKKLNMCLKKLIKKLSPANLFIFLIKAYQILFRPYVGHNCRFTPSCSDYALESFRRHGFIKGMALTVSRVTRCHPWSPGGIDEVPKK